MKTLHITPGQSAGGSLLRAVRDAGRDDKVLPYCDDLSCGPIESDAPSARAAWWMRFYEMPQFEELVGEFWKTVAATDSRLVVWYGRHSASELAFALSFADRLGSRPYDVVDVTGLQWQFSGPDGSTVTALPAPAVSIVPPYQLTQLFARARQVTCDEQAEASRQWQKLRKENAHFRIVTPTGLASVQADYFDPMLVRRASVEWLKIARVVGDVMADNYDPYCQVGDLMLLTRIVALVEQGKLLADGDPWNIQGCRVRLPEKMSLS